ncbi:sialidase family protein [Chitinophaga sp. Cy-1792]|uniref:sialidase family protein n=1 Tax=Chitinophaga sp. Cy-1792 TaxID=2608339 RepID=UPI001424678E|nr:sialidase family protein [Chitinophaga sp. Cy-1792]NIG53234.1 exo-alpha-sialidase [Chitinophaga sp. Cy-1792]
MKKWYLSGLVVLMIACGNQRKEESRVLSHAGVDASCPYVTNDSKGNTVISWVEKDSTGDNGKMFYAVSNGNEYTFSDPVVIPSTAGVFPHDENLPKLLFKPDGTIIALFGVEQHDARNKYAGKVLYTQSFDGGKSWEAPVALVTDTAGYDQRYFDMALLPNGEAAAIWLDNRKNTNAEGSTLYFSTTHGKEGFQDAKPVVETVCQCCRTKLYVDKSTSNIHIVYRDIINDSIRDMVHQVSADGGKTFSEPVRISADNWVVNGCPHTGPTLAANASGLHFAWFTMGHGKGVFYCHSTDNGKTYTQKESLSNVAMAKHPQLISAADGDIHIVWDEPVKVGDDYNSRIGYVRKSPEGKTIADSRITSDSSYANFPVLGTLNKEVLVAYKQRLGAHSVVMYKVL